MIHSVVNQNPWSLTVPVYHGTTLITLFKSTAFHLSNIKQHHSHTLGTRDSELFSFLHDHRHMAFLYCDLHFLVSHALQSRLRQMKFTTTAQHLDTDLGQKS